METFNRQGHVTDAALAALLDERLDEMARLEVAEHLGFCDGCLLRYTEMLSGDVLLTPARPTAPAVAKQLQRKTIKLGWLRYGTVAAAACMAVVMWGAGTVLLAERDPQPQMVAQSERGVFSLFGRRDEEAVPEEPAAQPTQTQGFLHFNWFSSADPPQTRQPDAPREARPTPPQETHREEAPQQAEREEIIPRARQREGLFASPDDTAPDKKLDEK